MNQYINTFPFTTFMQMYSRGGDKMTDNNIEQHQFQFSDTQHAHVWTRTVRLRTPLTPSVERRSVTVAERHESE